MYKLTYEETFSDRLGLKRAAETLINAGIDITKIKAELIDVIIGKEPDPEPELGDAPLAAHQWQEIAFKLVPAIESRSCTGCWFKQENGRCNAYNTYTDIRCNEYSIYEQIQ